MAAELIVAPEAEQDLGEAYAWYERQRVGLGEEFLSCVDACLRGICRSPQAHRLVHENYRRGLVRRFPYAVFYEHAEDTVTVYGVFHTSRDPNKWRERLA
jgi:plasmid stabilization system protein ParE